jgi:hypothetical protein
VITAVIIEGRSPAEVARTYNIASTTGQLRITWRPTQSSEKGRAFAAADSVGIEDFVPWEPRDESAGLRYAPTPLYRSASSCSRRWAISSMLSGSSLAKRRP